MYALDHGGAVDAARLLLDQPRAVFKQRAVDVERPAVQHIDDLARQIAEPPTPVGMHGQLAVAALQRVIKVDDTANKRGPENANAAKVEKVHGLVWGHSVIAEMRVTVDHAVVVERHVPDPEH